MLRPTVIIFLCKTEDDIPGLVARLLHTEKSDLYHKEANCSTTKR